MGFPLAAAKIPSFPQSIAVSAGAVFPALLGLVCAEQLPRVQIPQQGRATGPLTLSHSNQSWSHYLCTDERRSGCVFLLSFLPKSYITLPWKPLIFSHSSWLSFWHVQLCQRCTVQVHQLSSLCPLWVQFYESQQSLCVTPLLGEASHQITIFHEGTAWFLEWLPALSNAL